MCQLSVFFIVCTRDPRPPIPPRVMAWSAMGLYLGIFRFLHGKQMRFLSWRVVRRFTLVCLHAQITVHASNICTWTGVILVTGKTQRPQWRNRKIFRGEGGQSHFSRRDFRFFPVEISILVDPPAPHLLRHWKTPKFSPMPVSRWHRLRDLWCIYLFIELHYRHKIQNYKYKK